MLSWYSIVTPLGTIVCKKRGSRLSIDEVKEVEILDAHMVTQHEKVSYFDANGLEVEEMTALEKGLEPIVSGVVEDYIPIRPNIDPLKTIVHLNAEQIILYWHEGDRPDLDNYIDGINGRIRVKDLSDVSDGNSDAEKEVVQPVLEPSPK